MVMLDSLSIATVPDVAPAAMIHGVAHELGGAVIVGTASGSTLEAEYHLGLPPRVD